MDVQKWLALQCGNWTMKIMINHEPQDEMELLRQTTPDVGEISYHPVDSQKKNFQRLPCHGTLLQGWEAVEVELLLQVLQGDSGLGLEHDRFNQEM